MADFEEADLTQAVWGTRMEYEDQLEEVEEGEEGVEDELDSLFVVEEVPDELPSPVLASPAVPSFLSSFFFSPFWPSVVWLGSLSLFE